LKQSQEKAEENLKNRSLFFAKMTHEIRSPLNVILGISEYLYNEIPENSEHKQYFQTLFKTGNHLLDVVNDILDYSKVEAGKYKIDPTKFDLSLLVQSIRDQFDIEAKNKKISLNLEVMNIEGAVKGDKKCITQVLTNGLSNAIKFTPEGGMVKIKVYRPLGIESRNVIFSISDDGKGLSKEAENKVFESYSQENNSITNQFGGTGLGLTVSKHLVELMGGQISLKANEEKGATFLLSLPLDSVESKTIEKKGLNIIHINKKIEALVADDQNDNRLIVKLFLSKLSCNITDASDGQEALDLFKKNKYDIIIIDDEMPIMNGTEAIALMREHERQNNLPPTIILSLSGNTSQLDIEKMLQAGCNMYLPKPIRKDLLLEIIADFCQPRDSFIEWNDNFSVRVKSIDEQHKIIVKSINELFKAITTSSSIDSVPELIDRLAEYAKRHFSYEEALMEEFNYELFQSHQESHQKFFLQIEYYRQKLEYDSHNISLSLLYFLKKWLTKHILEEDMNYANLLESKKVA
jgi:hemerythrin-like metal-binding protein